MAARGEQEAAVAQYQQGLALDPGHARAHGNLGIVLVGRGRFAEARPHLEHALSPGPESAEFHSALGVVATEGGRPREAVRRYRDALERVPGLRSAALNLAWLLATSDDPTLRDGPEAVRLAEAAALRERRPQATTLGTLAAAYAASGRFEEAIRSAREAEALAAGRRRGSQRARILRQLERYRAGELFLASDALTDD